MDAGVGVFIVVVVVVLLIAIPFAVVVNVRYYRRIARRDDAMRRYYENEIRKSDNQK